MRHTNLTNVRRPIIVRRNYSDRTYLRFLRDAFNMERSPDARGRSPYYFNVMKPMLVEAEYRLNFDDGEKYEPDYDRLESDLKLITEFLREPNLENKTWIELFRFIDAFMQLKVPGFNSTYQKQAETNEVGMILGEFLRHPILGQSRHQLAVASQKIICTYLYDDVDTHRTRTKRKRALVLLQGDNIDYIRAVDFAFSKNMFDGGGGEKKTDFVSGFCIPGDGLSVLIMRSSLLQARYVGLLYTPGELIGRSGGLLDEVIHDVLTSDLSQQGSNSQDKSIMDPLVLKALDVHYGPRIQKVLRSANKIDNRKIGNFLKKIEINML